MSIAHAGALISFALLLTVVILFLPTLQRVFRRLSGAIGTPNPEERVYLESLVEDLERRNRQNNWADSLYVPLTSELKEADPARQIRERILHCFQKFYLVKTLHRSTNRQVFNTLSNVEKVDSSRGITFPNLRNAVDRADDNAVILLAPPGAGKSVSLRNLALADAHARLAVRTARIPIFLDLGRYIGYEEDGCVQKFPDFLEEFFQQNGYYSFLAGGRWKQLLSRDQCIFYLDGMDELPRRHPEYEQRAKEIETFIRRWPKTPFLLACRELDYDHQLTFQQILIKPFEYRQINDYLRRYFNTRRNGIREPSHPQPKQQMLVLERLLGNEALLDMCRSPFYLNLVCYYCESTGELPDSRVQLFTFLIESLVKRENDKLPNPADHLSSADFRIALSSLAFYMAVDRQSTTINLDDYREWLSHRGLPHLHDHSIQHAIAGNLLTFSKQSNQIRFCHNRFLEYFSSFVFVERYRAAGFAFPSNFFTNIWWVETIQFIAGLDDNAADFIRLLLAERAAVSHPTEEIAQLLRLDLLVLTFRCMFANLQFTDESLRHDVRALLFSEYEKGTPLERAKIVSALKLDDSEEVRCFLQRALDDRSSWVSETAFFAISHGELQFQTKYRTIIREFTRFFLEGRVFSTLLPVLRASQRSAKVRRSLPVFGLFILATLACGAAIVGVLAGFAHHLLFKLDYALTRSCLSCLFALSSASFLVAYYVLRGEGRIFRRAIMVAPLALAAYLWVFNGPNLGDHSVARSAATLTGSLLAVAVARLLRRRKGPLLLAFTTFYAGSSLAIAAIRLVSHPTAVNPELVDGFLGRIFVDPLKERVELDLVSSLKPPVSSVSSGVGYDALELAIKTIDTEIILKPLAPTTVRIASEAGVKPEQIRYRMAREVKNYLETERRSGRLTSVDDLPAAIQEGAARSLRPIAIDAARHRVASGLFYGVISLLGAALLWLLAWQSWILVRLARNRKRLLEIADMTVDRDAQVTSVVRVLASQSAGWARKLLIDIFVSRIVSRLGRSQVAVLTLLNRLAVAITDPDLQDTVLRELEQEQRSYRRALQGPATKELEKELEQVPGIA